MSRFLVSEDQSVSFTVEKPLSLGAHQVEISCDGYIFPSDKLTTITVKPSQEQYEVAEPLKKSLSEDDIILNIYKQSIPLLFYFLEIKNVIKISIFSVILIMVIIFLPFDVFMNISR